MSRKRRPLQLTADPALLEAAIADRVRRLREMLVLMAPETGSSALGGTLPCEPRRRFPEHLLLPLPDAANF